MKNVFKALNLPITKYKHVNEADRIDYAALEKELKYPLFVKPANLGSSIGVSKVDNQAELKHALEVAFYYDADAIVEEGVENLMELNCSVMRQNGKTVTSLVEHPVTEASFLTFNEKYTASDGGTMQGVEKKVLTPAPIPQNRTEEIQAMSKKIFEAFFCGS